MALIEIDGLAMKSMVDLSMAILNNQMVILPKHWENEQYIDIWTFLRLV